MNNKKSMIDRLDQIKIESGHSEKAFKDVLATITGKTSRTIRRWYSLESKVHDNDIELIAKFFGKHVHWLRYGNRNATMTPIDQIMSSDHFGVVILKDNKVEEVNFKFTEMMRLSLTESNQHDICDQILTTQPSDTIRQCNESNHIAFTDGAHIDQIVMRLGDNKEHHIETTTLNISNGRILKVLFDKGPTNNCSEDTPLIADDDVSSGKTNGSALNVLLVDDDPANCQLYTRLLSVHNCSTTTYINSITALNEFKQNPEYYDLLIADIIMPEMTGDKLADECRKVNPELPVILYTGYHEHLNKTTAEEYGVSYCLQKPIKSKQLVSILETFR